MLKKEKIVRVIKWILSFLLIFLALIIIFSTKWSLINYQFNNFDQILFTLTSSVASASNDLIEEFIKENVLIPFIITMIIISIVIIFKHIFKHLEAYITIKIRNKSFKLNFYNVIKYLFLLSLVSYSIYYAMSNLYIIDYIKYNYIESNFLEVNYVEPEEVKLEWPDEKRN